MKSTSQSPLKKELFSEFRAQPSFIFHRKRQKIRKNPLFYRKKFIKIKTLQENIYCALEFLRKTLTTFDETEFSKVKKNFQNSLIQSSYQEKIGVYCNENFGVEYLKIIEERKSRDLVMEKLKSDAEFFDKLKEKFGRLFGIEVKEEKSNEEIFREFEGKIKDFANFMKNLKIYFEFGAEEIENNCFDSGIFDKVLEKVEKNKKILKILK